MARDRAVFYGYLWKGTTALSAPVTLVLIAQYFDPVEQGYFYTFASLLALQSFFELGFYIVVTYVAAHEWAHLSVGPRGEVCGDGKAKARLASLVRLVIKWYLIASALFLLIVLLVGLFFFAQQPQTGVQWQAPWIVLVIAAAIIVFATPFTALLEGCNQVQQVYRFNFFQALLSSIAGWVAIVLGAGLWTAVVMPTVRIAVIGSLLLVRYRHFFGSLMLEARDERVSWKKEIWPMQWRLALSGLVSYFAFALFTPVMFHYHGAEVAGQMGMTLQIVFGVQGLALLYLMVLVPKLGMYVARKEWTTLDAVWWKGGLKAILAYLTAAVAVLLVLTALHWYGHAFTGRVLPLDAMAVLFGGAMLMVLSQFTSTYMRAHKVEPIVVMSVTCSLLIGIAVVTLGRAYGAHGAAWGYLLCTILVVAWGGIIWVAFRKDRNAREANADLASSSLI